MRKLFPVLMGRILFFSIDVSLLIYFSGWAFHCPYNLQSLKKQHNLLFFLRNHGITIHNSAFFTIAQACQVCQANPHYFFSSFLYSASLIIRKGIPSPECPDNSIKLELFKVNFSTFCFKFSLDFLSLSFRSAFFDYLWSFVN